MLANEINSGASLVRLSPTFSDSFEIRKNVLANVDRAADVFRSS